MAVTVMPTMDSRGHHTRGIYISIYVSLDKPWTCLTVHQDLWTTVAAYILVCATKDWDSIFPGQAGTGSGQPLLTVAFLDSSQD